MTNNSGSQSNSEIEIKSFNNAVTRSKPPERSAPKPPKTDNKK